MPTATNGNAAWRALSDRPGRLAGQEVDSDRSSGHEVLSRVGFANRQETMRAVSNCLMLGPNEVRLASVRRIPKGSRGRGGLPAFAVGIMYQEYQRLRSLAKVAALFKRSRQSIYSLFVRHGCVLNQRHFRNKIEWGGCQWTPGKGGYYRRTSGDRKEFLHQAIWRSLHGEIPAGHQVTFENGDREDFSPGNLMCLPVAEVTLHHYRRHFPERSVMSASERREFWKAHYRAYANRRSRENIAKGLRSDGKPRKRIHNENQ